MAGLGGKKQTCRRYKRGPSGKLRCAEKMPTSQCVPRQGKRCTGAPISKRSKLYRRVKAGVVDGLGRCHAKNGRFKKCR